MKRFFYWLVLLLCVVLFGVCAWQIWNIVSEYNTGTTLYEETATQFVTILEPEDEASDAEGDSDAEAEAETETEDSLEEEEPVEIAEEEEAEEETEEEGKTEKEEGSVPISVDFDALLKTNSDVVGWIYCPNTNINYPVLQGETNDTYLRHMIDGSYNSAGSIFLDYRNTSDFSDANSIIYGHNMQNSSMFSSLMSYKKQSYYDKHPVLWLLTPSCTYRLDIIGGCVMSADSDFYNSLLWGDDVESQINYILSNSTFDASAEWDGESTVISLSTCSHEYNNARYVLLCVPVQVDGD
ncbi:MAG: class B sortase [Clostridiales bacterium]|nr:class B sortase [Clostridiales bacterium]